MEQAAIERMILDFLDALDNRDGARLAAALAENAVYDPGDGARVIGRNALRDALVDRVGALDERHGDIVTLVSADGSRAAAEVTLRGTYMRTLAGLPEAAGQSYSIPAGLFFEIDEGRIARFTRYLSTGDWRRQLQRQ